MLNVIVRNVTYNVLYSPLNLKDKYHPCVLVNLAASIPSTKIIKRISHFFCVYRMDYRISRLVNTDDVNAVCDKLYDTIPIEYLMRLCLTKI